MSTVDRRQILRAGAALPIVAALGGLARPDTALAATCFSAYDNTTYTDVRIGQLAGFPTCGVIYDKQQAGWEDILIAGGKLPAGELEYWVRYKADRTPGPIVLDFERIYLKAHQDPEMNNKRYATWIDIINRTKTVLDAEYGGRRFGMWGFTNYGWDLQYLSMAQDLAARTDIHFPNMYAGDQEDAPHFSSRLDNALYRSNQLEPNLPIYAYIWPQWRPNPADPSTWTFIPEKVWRGYLNAILAKKLDGFAIWNSWSSNTVGSTNRGWVNATIDFIADLPAPGVCPAS